MATNSNNKLKNNSYIDLASFVKDNGGRSYDGEPIDASDVIKKITTTTTQNKGTGYQPVTIGGTDYFYNAGTKELSVLINSLPRGAKSVPFNTDVAAWKSKVKKTKILDDAPGIIQGQRRPEKGEYKAAPATTVVFLAKEDGKSVASAMSFAMGELSAVSGNDHLNPNKLESYGQTLFANFLRESQKEKEIEAAKAGGGGDITKQSDAIASNVNNYSAWTKPNKKYDNNGKPGITGASFIRRSNMSTLQAYDSMKHIPVAERVDFSKIQMPPLTFNSMIEIRRTLEVQELKIEQKLNLNDSSLQNINITAETVSEQTKDIKIKPLYTELQTIKQELEELRVANTRILGEYDNQLKIAQNVINKLDEKTNQNTASIANLTGNEAYEKSLENSQKTLNENNAKIVAAEEKLAKATKAYEAACEAKAKNFIDNSQGGAKLDKETLIQGYKNGKLGEGEDKGTSFKPKTLGNTAVISNTKKELSDEKKQITELKDGLKIQFDKYQKERETQLNQDIKTFAERQTTQQEVDQKTAELKKEAEWEVTNKKEELEKEFAEKIEKLKAKAESVSEELTSRSKEAIEKLRQEYQDNLIKVSANQKTIEENHIKNDLQPTEIKPPGIEKIEIPKGDLTTAINLDDLSVKNIQITATASSEQTKDIQIKPLYTELQTIKQELADLQKSNESILENHATQLKAANDVIKNFKNNNTNPEGAPITNLTGNEAYEKSLENSQKTLNENEAKIVAAEAKLAKATEAYEAACKAKAQNFIDNSQGGATLDKETLIEEYKNGKLGEGEGEGTPFQPKELGKGAEINLAKTSLSTEKDAITQLKQNLNDEFNKYKQEIEETLKTEIFNFANNKPRPTQEGVNQKKNEAQQEAANALAERKEKLEKEFADTIKQLKEKTESIDTTLKSTQEIEKFNKEYQDNLIKVSANQKTIEENHITNDLKPTQITPPGVISIDTNFTLNNVGPINSKLEIKTEQIQAGDIKIAPAYIDLLKANEHVAQLTQKNNDFNNAYEEQIKQAEAVINNASTGKDSKDAVLLKDNETYNANKQEEDRKKENNAKQLQEAIKLRDEMKVNFEEACKLKAQNFIDNSGNGSELNQDALIAAYKEGQLGEEASSLSEEARKYCTDKNINITNGEKFTSKETEYRETFTGITKQAIAKATQAQNAINEQTKALQETINGLVNDGMAKLNERIAGLASQEIPEAQKKEQIETARQEAQNDINKEIVEAKQNAQTQIDTIVNNANNDLETLQAQIEGQQNQIESKYNLYSTNNEACTALKDQVLEDRIKVESKDVTELNINPPSIDGATVVYSTQDLSVSELHKMYHESKEVLEKLKSEQVNNLQTVTNEFNEAEKKQKDVSGDTKLPDSVSKSFADEAAKQVERMNANENIYKLAEEKAKNIEEAFKKACELKAKNYLENSNKPIEGASQENVAKAYFETSKDKNPDKDTSYTFNIKNVTMEDMAKDLKIDLSATVSGENVTALKNKAKDEKDQFDTNYSQGNAEISNNKSVISKNLDSGEKVEGNDKTAADFTERGLKQMGMNEMHISIDTATVDMVPDFANNLKKAIAELETANNNYKNAVAEQAKATEIYKGAISALAEIQEEQKKGENGAQYEEDEIIALQKQIKDLEQKEISNKKTVDGYEAKLQEARAMMDTAIEQYNENSSYYQNVNEISDRFSKEDVPVSEKAGEQADLNASITDLNDINLSVTEKEGLSLEERITQFKVARSSQVADINRVKDDTCTFISEADCKTVNTKNAKTTQEINAFKQAIGGIDKGNFDVPSPILNVEIETVVETPKKSIPSFEKNSGFRMAIVGDPGDIDRSKYSLDSDSGLMVDKSGNPHYKYAEFGGKNPISQKASDVYNKSFNACMLNGASAVAHVNTKPTGKGDPRSMHQVHREFLPNEIEGSLIIGNAKTGFLEIKSNADTKMDQLTIVKKNGEKVELFNPNPITGVSSAREFHQAFKNNYNLNSPQHTESVYHNAIDPKTQQRIRIFVSPQGFYHTNEQGGVDRSRKISYQEMDKICEATIAHAKEINCGIYSDKTKPAEKEQIKEMDNTMASIKESKEAIDKGEVLIHKFAKDAVEVKVDPKDTTINQVTAKTPDNKTADLFTESSLSPSKQFLDEFKKTPEANRETIYFNAAHPEDPQYKVKIKLTKDGEFKALDGKGGETPLDLQDMDAIVKATIERAKEKECIALDGGKAAQLAEAAKNIVVGTTNPPSAPEPAPAPISPPAPSKEKPIVIGTEPTPDIVAAPPAPTPVTASAGNPAERKEVLENPTITKPATPSADASVTIGTKKPVAIDIEIPTLKPTNPDVESLVKEASKGKVSAAMTPPTLAVPKKDDKSAPPPEASAIEKLSTELAKKMKSGNAEISKDPPPNKSTPTETTSLPGR